VAAHALSRAGWQVISVESAEAALAWDGRPDLLISDIAMAGMDGATLVREAWKIWPDLPAVLVSGYAESALRGDLPVGRVVFLPKPYSLAELLHTVDGVLK
jgi:two-component system cell cycle sensor histidine kinase/response regulator CckA